MREPAIKRVNTVSFKFLKGERDKHVVAEYLNSVLHIDSTDIVGVGDEGRSSIFIKFARRNQYDAFVTNHGGKTITANAFIFQIIDVSSYCIRVSMKNVPFELNNSVLRNLLGKYGSVKEVYMCTEVDNFFAGAITMERYALMKDISTPIPSTLFLNLTQGYIYFNYLTQTKTCNRCGSSDHHAGNCEVSKVTRPQDRENVINFNAKEFPELSRHQPRNSAQCQISPESSEIGGPLNAPGETASVSIDTAVVADTDSTHVSTQAPATTNDEILGGTGPETMHNDTQEKDNTDERNVINSPAKNMQNNILENNHFNANVIAMQNQANAQNATKHLHDQLKVIRDNPDQYLAYSDAVVLSPKHISYSARENMNFFAHGKALQVGQSPMMTRARATNV